MASLRRTVHGQMGKMLYEGLGDQPDIEKAWGLLRDLIGAHLFRYEFVPVPFIKSAVYYNQQFVFIKKQKLLSKMTRRRPSYKVVGNMDYLVNRGESRWIPQSDFSPWDIADNYNMYSEYKLRIWSHESDVEKFVELTVYDAHVRSAQPPIPGDVKIHRSLLKDLERVKFLYFITDVVLANTVKLDVRIGNQTMNCTYNCNIPVGFKYKKYKLHEDGTFAAEIRTSIKTGNEVIWLQPLPQPIPPVPRYDKMRRRNDGKANRKMRSNLTIATLDELLIHRRPEEEDEFVLPIERIAESNAAIVQARDVIHNLNVNNWMNPARFQNQRLAARSSVSMEALRGSDDQDDYE